MNPRLDLLQPYPFERLRQLFAGTSPNPHYAPINLGIGEPRHPTPALLQQTLCAAVTQSAGLAGYPATAGTAAFRQACAEWLHRRYAVKVDAATQVLSVNGSREALFSFAQAMIDPTCSNATVICPNPFYQIYEGAALLAGATPYFAASVPARNFAVDWDAVPADIWQRTQLIYVCSPGNPTGAVMPLSEWEKLFALADMHGFVIASDECYSEIYFREQAPLGALEAATQLGRSDFRQIVMFTSLSKRSNAPGLRSGFVAGDAELIRRFLLYRTYHGSAMSPVVQAASIAAWNDEEHVINNRKLYREKFDQVTPILEQALNVALPDAGFYLWADIGTCCNGSDTAFARHLYEQYNVTVLPGSYLAREAHGSNPGAGRIRMALVAETAQCLEAAERIRAFVQALH